MKIVFCGPPHSGKSVFLANIIDNLPTDAYTVIRACPDGEGTWSNNQNQKETNLVRQKGKFTQAFIEDACRAIDNQTNKIVLVDVGGKISEENEQILKHCDNFIVLSNNEEKKQEWLEFAGKLGLQCVGCFDFSIEGKEEIYTREPYIQGRIVGLERGKMLGNSSVIKAIVSDIIQKSKYKEQEKSSEEIIEGIKIDDTQLGFALEYGKIIETEDGTQMKKVKWEEKAIPRVYQMIQENVKSNEPIKINGIRANFILSAISKAAKAQGVKDIRTYDIRQKQYIPIRELPQKKRIKQTEGLAYHLIENKENAFLDIDITKEQYSMQDYEKCILPKIKENKNLYLSGRLPLWLLASMVSSYNLQRIFTFQPGKGFTCVSSIDEKELGNIVDGVDGIDINRYYEDKKDKTNLVVVTKEEGILAKWRRVWKDRKAGGKKYLDETVQSHKIIVEEMKNTGKSLFQEGLQQTILEKTNMSEKLVMPEKREVKEKTDIGG